jgi:myo-inositol-1(or 4)-monophosphatase
MLARGDIDAIVGYRIGEFDLHAGAVIAAASGIEVRDLDGGPFDARLGDLSENRNLIAAAPERLDEVLGFVRAVI